MRKKFAKYVREKREKLREYDSQFSLRQVAFRIGIQPAYLSKLERGEQAPLSEEKTIALAEELGENTDFLLAMSGKVSSDLKEIIRERPQIFANLIRQLKDVPDDVIIRMGNEAKDKKG